MVSPLLRIACRDVMLVCLAEGICRRVQCFDVCLGVEMGDWQRRRNWDGGETVGTIDILQNLCGIDAADSPGRIQQIGLIVCERSLIKMFRSFGGQR